MSPTRAVGLFACLALLPGGAWGTNVAVPVEIGAVNPGGAGAAGSVGSMSGQMGSASSLGPSVQIHNVGSTLPGGYTPRVQTGPGINASAAPVATGGRAVPAQFSLPSAISNTGSRVPGGASISQPGARTRTRTRTIPSDGGGTGAASSLKTRTGRTRTGAAIDPRKDPGSENSGVQALDIAIQDIEKAKDSETRGVNGAVAAKLDNLFDFSGSKTGEALNFMSKSPAGVQDMVEANLPDPKLLGVDGALDKVYVLAEAAGPADAPFLYQYAVDLAREQIGGEAGQARAGRILAAAARKAPGAVEDLALGAFRAAAKGRTTDAFRYTKGIHGWNSLLSSERRPYISNFAELRDAVKHVLAQALDTPGADLPAPRVTFRRLPGKTHRLKALVSIPEGVKGQVAAVPASLSMSFALPEAEAAWDTAAEISAPGLSSAFRLTPQAGFRQFYRAGRTAGRSVLGSFFMAAREFLSARMTSLWQRLRAFFVSILRKIGILESAAPGLLVRADSEALTKLRSLPAERITLSRSRELDRDGLGLGYRLYPVAP